MHTPGPWKLNAAGVSVVTEATDRNGGWPNGMKLALTCHNVPLRERQANARLMAAAPDLLAACKALVAVLVSPMEADQRMDDTIVACRQAQEAIRQAEGT